MKLVYLLMLGVAIKLKQTIKKSLIGQNHMFSQKIQSVELIKITYNFMNTVNRLSCVILDIEHFHSAAHFKSPSLTYLQYERAFGSTIN